MEWAIVLWFFLRILKLLINILWLLSRNSVAKAVEIASECVCVLDAAERSTSNGETCAGKCLCQPFCFEDCDSGFKSLRSLNVNSMHEVQFMKGTGDICEEFYFFFSIHINYCNFLWYNQTNKQTSRTTFIMDKESYKSLVYYSEWKWSLGLIWMAPHELIKG